MRLFSADTKTIERVLQRHKWQRDNYSSLDLTSMLTDILKWANAFVPSESGSILLDDPILTKTRSKPDRLYFVACFGKGAKPIAGSAIPSNLGIVGKTYKSGKAYISKTVRGDKNFYKGIDKKTKYKTRSIICVPIQIHGSTVGVLELINRHEKINYDAQDLKLLKIFAGYTSTLIQNSLDAKRFSELSIKDNLTGLYNDRYFFESIGKLISEAKKKKKDLGLIFIDLDRFKEVNDTYGHLAGSRLLNEVGVILMSYTNYNDKIVPIRYGGDEFIIILPGFDSDRAKAFAEDIRETIEGYTFISQKYPGLAQALNIKNVVTASIGVASLNKNVPKGLALKPMIQAIVKASDKAMYDSKTAGKNTVTVASGHYKM